MVPIVFANVTDPVGQGFVASLSHPGGNLTGFSHSEITMGVKWLEVLKELAPSIRKIGFLFNPSDGALLHLIDCCTAVLNL